MSKHKKEPIYLLGTVFNITTEWTTQKFQAEIALAMDRLRNKQVCEFVILNNPYFLMFHVKHY